MGHRSSKPSAGLTDGNTSVNKNSTKGTSAVAKLSKQSTRRQSSRVPKTRSTNRDNNPHYRHSIASLNSSSSNVATVYGDKLLPILRLDSGDSLATENSSGLTSVTNNSTGQIIIKIRFKTHTPGDMDNASENTQPSLAAAAESCAPALMINEGYRRLVDTNSNKVPLGDVDLLRAAGSSPNAALNSNSACNTNNNNNRSSLPVHLNALRITEPLLDQGQDSASSVEYYEVTEDATTSTRPRPDTSRRQKAKSAFLNFRSILESSSSSSKSQPNKISSNSNNNNSSSSSNHSHSIPQMPPATQQQLRQHQYRPYGGETASTNVSTVSSSSIYHDTPMSNATAATTSNALMPGTPLSITTSTATLPLSPPQQATATTNQLAIWAANKDVIISAINLVVCPSTTGVTLERLMSTELVAGNSGNGGSDKGSGEREQASAMLTSSLLKSGSTQVTAATPSGPIVHSQVDFVHYLVPDLLRIFNSSFYWGKMDRYEAERLLEGKPEGTFLLRDSAQEEYLFSVTFRKYGRSLHARIEQSGHKFSFDSHDPAVFSTSTVTGLLEHYKDPGSVMFFEPMLTVPFHRRTVFSLQQLARAAIVSNTTYDGISELELPVRLKAYLKEYHYKQKLRVKLLDDTLLTCA